MTDESAAVAAEETEATETVVTTPEPTETAESGASPTDGDSGTPSDSGEPSEPTEPSAAAGDGGSAEPAEPPAEPGQKGRGVQKRFDKLTQQRREAEERAARAEADLARIRQAAQGAKAPNEADFDSYDAYLVARDEYTAAQVEHRVLERIRSEESQAAVQGVQQVQQQAVAEFNSEGAGRFEDWDKVVLNPQLVMNQHMVDAMASLDRGTEVAYHLGKNPRESARIASLSPVQAALELGRLERTLPTPKKVSNAPPPPSQIGTANDSVPADPDKAKNMREYEAARRKQHGGSVFPRGMR